ncbi:MAG: asparagine synthase [Acidobacteria bacterium]|nr:asparagine synthase [Acidobacteriota bacterium]
MTRPPLANLLALHDPEPLALDAVEAEIRGSGRFAETWRPAPRWLVALTPLPGGEPDGPEFRAAGLVFAEGRDRVVGASRRAEAIQRVARAADSGGPDLRSLPGDFGFMRFRPSGETTVVRSCGGLVPFYVWHERERAAVATRLTDLVRHLPNDLPIDPLVNAVWLAGWPLFPDRRTFLRSVEVLERGHILEISSAGRLTTREYWDPRPDYLEHPTRTRAREHAERLRSLLLSTLERDLDPDGGNLLKLSGGVDSSSLAALAAGVMGKRVSILTLVPPEGESLLRHEHFINMLAERYPFEQRWTFPMTLVERVALLQEGPRVAFHAGHPALLALPRISSQAPVRVLFGGEFADEVCGSAASMSDWFRHTSLPRILVSGGSLPYGPRDILRWGKWHMLVRAGRPRLPFPANLPVFVQPKLKEEYREWLDRRQARFLGDRKPLAFLALRSEQDPFVSMNWEAASLLGIRVSVPFFTREMLELAFDCHPRELVGPGTKRLLRAALHQDVPHGNLYRKDKGTWPTDADLSSVDPPIELPRAAAEVVESRWLAGKPRALKDWDAMLLWHLRAFLASVDMLRTDRRGAAGQAPH